MTERRFGQLGLRVATAAVLLPPVVWVVWRGGLALAILASLVAAVAAFEFSRLAVGALPWEAWVAIVTSALLPLLPVLSPLRRWPLAMALLIALSILSWSSSALRGVIHEGAQRASALVSGCVFCGASLLCLVELRSLENGRAWLFCMLLAVWANDVSAFFGGRLVGRHKLAPRVSPGKSWEGWALGWLGAFAVVEAASLSGALPIPWPHAAAIAAIASVAGPLGDLSKSLLKRARGVKDAGRIIPGHGGMLDRVDSLLFTSPVVLAWVELFGQ